MTQVIYSNLHPKDLSKSPAAAGFFYRHLGLVGCNITFRSTKKIKMRETQYNTPIKRTIK